MSSLEGLGLTTHYKIADIDSNTLPLTRQRELVLEIRSQPLLETRQYSSDNPSLGQTAQHTPRQRPRSLTRGVPVEGKVVNSPTGDVADDSRGGDGLDVAAKSLRCLLSQKCQEVGAKTGDVGRGHGRA